MLKTVKNTKRIHSNKSLFLQSVNHKNTKVHTNAIGATAKITTAFDLFCFSLESWKLSLVYVCCVNCEPNAVFNFFIYMCLCMYSYTPHDKIIWSLWAVAAERQVGDQFKLYICECKCLQFCKNKHNSCTDGFYIKSIHSEASDLYIVDPSDNDG